MKKVCLLAGLFIFIFACNYKQPTSQKDLFGEEVAQEDGTVFETTRVKDLNPSSIHFNNAITSFENGKMEEAVIHLKEGTNALVNEGKFLKGEPKARLKSSVQALENTITKIEKGELKNIEELQKIVASVQLGVAQEYAVDLDVYTVIVPLPDSYYPNFKAAMKAIQGAEIHMKGAAQQDAQNLIKDSQKIMDQIDAGATIDEDQIKNQRKQMETFLKQHHLQ